ncbi:MAG: glycerophosphodiester phosphodiesterase family protein [Burkholderiaceae bacterium]
MDDDAIARLVRPGPPTWPAVRRLARHEPGRRHVVTAWLAAALMLGAGAAAAFDLSSRRSPTRFRMQPGCSRAAAHARRGAPEDDPAWTDGMLRRDHASVAHMVKAAGGTVWAPHQASLDADAVKRAQQLGLQVIPWTVNEPADMRRLIDWGVDGIISDYPRPPARGDARARTGPAGRRSPLSPMAVGRAAKSAP